MSLSVNARMLEGYLLKCGVDGHSALTVAKLFGDRYLELQSQARMQGFGKMSKAVGAMSACEAILSHYSNPNRVSSEGGGVDDYISAIVRIRSATVSILAVSAYAYNIGINTEELQSTLKDADNLIGSLEKEANNQIITDKASYYREALKKEAPEVVATAKALGLKKGFLSKLLG